MLEVTFSQHKRTVHERRIQVEPNEMNCSSGALRGFFNLRRQSPAKGRAFFSSDSPVHVSFSERCFLSNLFKIVYFRSSKVMSVPKASVADEARVDLAADIKSKVWGCSIRFQSVA